MTAIKNAKGMFLIRVNVEPWFSDGDPEQIIGEYKAVKMAGINLYAKTSIYGIPITWDEWLSRNASEVHALSKEIGCIHKELREIKKNGISIK